MVKTMIESLYLSLLFIFPGLMITEIFISKFKYKYLLIPFISFAYFNFLTIIFFIFDFGPFRFWFYFFALMPIFLIFKIKNLKKFFTNFLYIFLGFISLNAALSYFSLISLPGNTYHTFDEIYKLFYMGSKNMDIGLIPLPMFTAGLFTNYSFSYSIINIFIIQFLFTTLFSILNYVDTKKGLLISIILFFANIMIFQVFYELITFRSHSLTASSLMILFVMFHKFGNEKPETFLLFITVFILFNSRLENVLFGYFYIFIFKLLNQKKFELSKKLILSSSLLAGGYLSITLRTLPVDDIRSNTIFILSLVLLGSLFVYKSFFKDKIIFISSYIFVTFYLLTFYTNNKEIFRSFASVVYTKLLDPNSGFGLQFLLITCIFIYFSNQSKSIPTSFFNYILFISFLTLLIGLLQTSIYLPDTTLDSIENSSIFNPLDLSIFRGLVQTIAIFWLVCLGVYLEKDSIDSR